jgi:hypothetical protein
MGHHESCGRCHQSVCGYAQQPREPSPEPIDMLSLVRDMDSLPWLERDGRAIAAYAQPEVLALARKGDALISELRTTVAAQAAEIERLKESAPREPFDVRCADALADEVDALIRRNVIDSRSPAADALLDYRDPPRTPRSARIAALEEEVARLSQPVRKAVDLATLISEHTTLALASREAAITGLAEAFIRETGAQAKDCVLVEQWKGDKLTWQIKLAGPGDLPGVEEATP